jgi:hypothetical protein
MNTTPPSTPPPPKWFAEAQVPGAEPHTFETYSEDAARAYCDAVGWDFLRAWQAGGHSDRPERKTPAAERPLSPRQVQALIVEAQMSHRALDKMTGGDVPAFDEWRAAQLRTVVRGVESFRRVPARYYNTVKNHFRSLRGAPPVGNPGKHRKQSGERGDSLQHREEILFLIGKELGAHAKRAETCEHCQAKGGALTEAYLMTIARAKNTGHALGDIGDLIKLPVSRLEQILYTIRNRIATREGRKGKK